MLLKRKTTAKMIDVNILELLEYHKIIDYIKRHAVTDGGKQLLTELLPIFDKEEIIKNGQFVSEAKNILIHGDFPPISYLSNLHNCLSRSSIDGTVLKQTEIIEILNLAEISRKMYSFLNNYGNSTTLFQEYRDRFFIDKNFENHIRKIFTENGEISDNASVKLKEIRREIIEKSDSLRKVINKILKQLSDSYVVQEEYTTQRDGRLVIQIKAEHKRQVRGFIHSESAKGQTVYIEPANTH